MSHWTLEYLGTPWVAGVSDCWNFARQVWQERFGYVVPAATAVGASSLAAHQAFRDADKCGWVEVIEPREGDAVLMGKGGRPCHVGIWVAADDGGVLHSVEGSGAIFTRIGGLSLTGYRVLAMYRWVTA